MKYKILFLLTSLALSLSAENITKDKAKEMALEFFKNNKPQLTVSDLQMVYDGETPVSRTSGAKPTFYVFNNPNGKGFVIIAGDDIAQPVLGYSYENSFQTDNMPSNVKVWLDGMKEQINKGRKAGITCKPSSRALSQAGEPVVQLKTAQWNQHAPYNNYTPVIEGVHAPTGCVITAAAIVMRYYKWPERGIGTVPGYTTGSQIEMPAIELGHTYDWDKMPNIYGENYTDEEAHQIARLMADLGTMLVANYSKNETYSGNLLIPNALRTYMDYDIFMSYKSRSDYLDDKWNQMLQAELNNDRPIIYGGSSDTGGHAFILDGYTTASYYSVNWGWGGNSNGYYLLSALNGYNNGQDAIFGIKPNVAVDILGDIIITDGIYPFNAERIEFNLNSPFELALKGICNIGKNEFMGKLKVALTDKHGVVKEELFEIRPAGMKIFYDYMYYIQCTITKPITVGDRIRLFYIPEGGTEWILIRGNEYSHWELPITDECTIEEATNIRYDKKNNTLVIQTKDGVDVQLVSEIGISLNDHCTTEGVTTTINTQGLQAGTYLLKLTKTIEACEIKIKLGDSK